MQCLMQLKKSASTQTVFIIVIIFAHMCTIVIYLDSAQTALT